MRPLSQAACAVKARAFHRELARIVERVEALKPPQNVEQTQELFLVNAHQTVDVIGRLADRVAAGEVRCGFEYNGRAYGLASTERAQQAVEELECKGYFVFGD